MSKSNEWMKTTERMAEATLLRAAKLVAEDELFSADELEVLMTRFGALAPNIRDIVAPPVAKRLSTAIVQMWRAGNIDISCNKSISGTQQLRTEE